MGRQERRRRRKPDDVRELLNYRQAFNLVSEYLESGEPITEGLIREIHKRLVRECEAGRAVPARIARFKITSRTAELVKSFTRRRRPKKWRR